MTLADVAAIAVWNRQGFANTRGVWIIANGDIQSAIERLDSLKRMNPEYSEAQIYFPPSTAPADVRKKAGMILSTLTDDYTIQESSSEFCRPI